MKLIIDIDEERLETIRKYPLIYNSDEYKAIAHGIPYNPTGDLISREALKEAFKGWKGMDDYYHNTDCIDIPFSEAYDLIDNAPTVEAYTDTNLIEENKKRF